MELFLNKSSPLFSDPGNSQATRVSVHEMFHNENGLTDTVEQIVLNFSKYITKYYWYYLNIYLNIPLNSEKINNIF